MANSDFSDGEIVVNGERIPVHKPVLLARCPSIDSKYHWFSHIIAELLETVNKSLTSISKEPFLELLRQQISARSH